MTFWLCKLAGHRFIRMDYSRTRCARCGKDVTAKGPT